MKIPEIAYKLISRWSLLRFKAKVVKAIYKGNPVVFNIRMVDGTLYLPKNAVMGYSTFIRNNFDPVEEGTKISRIDPTIKKGPKGPLGPIGLTGPKGPKGPKGPTMCDH